MFLVGIYSFRLPVFNKVNFFNHYPCIPSRLGVFQFGTLLSESTCILAFGPTSSPSESFPWCLSNLLFCYVLLIPIFCFKIVWCPGHPVVGMFSCIHPLSTNKKCSLVWYVLFCLYCFVLSNYLCLLVYFFELYCLLNSLSWVFFFSSQHVIFFACCRRFLIYVPSRISHPGFEFRFLFFRGAPVLSQTNFAPTYVNSFNSIPSFCRVTSKITWKCKFVVFSRPFSVFVSLVCVVT